MTKNRQQNGSLNRNFLNFFYWYGIFWMPPGESSHPGGSEYVWQRGVEGVLGWVTGGRSWPYFQQKKQLKWAVKKNRYGHNFQNIASKTNQRGLIVSEPTLIQFGADILKIVAVSFFGFSGCMHQKIFPFKFFGYGSFYEKDFCVRVQEKSNGLGHYILFSNRRIF